MISAISLYPGCLGLVVGLVALVIAAIYDIKTREVPDWLSFTLFAFALGSAIILSIAHGYAHIIVSALLGLAIGCLIGLLMFYTGQWGGGDAKLIIGLCVLIGLNFSDFKSTIPILLVFLINILLAGAIYGLGFSFVKALANFQRFKPVIEKKLRSRGVLIIRILLLVLGIAAFMFLLITKSVESALLFSFALALFLFYYIWVFVGVVEKVCMIRKVKTSKLTEGDWVVEKVMKNRKTLYKPERTGITLKEIAMLRKNKIKEVTIKIGVPFVPSFLIAYVITFAFGNWLAMFA